MVTWRTFACLSEIWFPWPLSFSFVRLGTGGGVTATPVVVQAFDHHPRCTSLSFCTGSGVIARPAYYHNSLFSLLHLTQL